MNKKHLWLLHFSLTTPVFADDVIDLPPLIVEATTPEIESQKNYSSTHASTATRTKTPLRDIPQTIDVRTQKLFSDIGGLQRTDDIAKTVPGITTTWNGNGGSNIPILNFRGFSNSSGYNSSDFMKDGYRKLSSISSTMDLANIEQIEFLKGPSSVLYGGTNTLGGVLNFISKRPLPQQRQHLSFTGGSWDFYRGTLDVGTALNAEKTALFRLNAAVEDTESFRDFANHQTQFIAPSFSYEFSNGDKFTALLDYTNTTMLGDFGMPITPAFAQVPRNNYFQQPDFDHTHAWSVNTLFEYEHWFNSDWKLTAGISTSWLDWSQNYTRFYSKKDALGQFIEPLTAIRQPNTEHTAQHDRNIELTLQGHLNFMGMAHQVLWGGGYITNEGYDDNLHNGQTYYVNLLQPDYGHHINWGNTAAGYDSVHTENITTFAQDLITITPRLKVLLGVRFDDVRRAGNNINFYGSTGKDTQTDTRFSPRYGIVYQPTDSTSLYANYTTSFAQRANFFLEPTDRYKPEIGEQYEIGIKQTFTPQWDVTLALFQLTRQNMLLNNTNAVPRSYRQMGEQQSCGLELSAIGQITDNFRLTGAYTWMQAEVTKDNVLKAGTERVGVPNHSLNLFGVYNFTGLFNGLEAGMGLHYNSSVNVSMPNTFKLPDTVQWDAMLSYQLKPYYKIQANIKNITDRRNYMVTDDFGYITLSTPRSFYISFSVDF